MTTSDTPNFGLTRVGKGEDLSKGGYKALDKDRQTLDSILKALATHTHAGESALTPPDVAPVGVVSASGGTLPPGVTYYYTVGYLDKFGLETAASPPATVTTAAAVTPPSSVLLSSAGSGTLQAGLYSYAVSFVQTTGGETTTSPAYSLAIDGGSTGTAVKLDLPSKPDPTLVYRIYRSRPGQSTLYFLADTGSTPYTDTGSVAEDATRLTPNFNTTNAFQKVTLTIPGTAAAPGAVPPDVKGWNIYRTDNPGQYTGANLVHSVIEPNTVGGTDLRTTWDDTRADLLNGAPQQNNSTINMPPPLSAQAFEREPAITNMVTNPSFETNTTSWSLVDASTPSTTLTRVQTGSVGGQWSAQLVGTVANKDAYLQASITCAASTTYAVSAYSFLSAYTASALGGRGLYITDGTSVVSTVLNGGAQYLGDWFRHIASLTTSSVATALTIRLYAPQGTVLWDSIQMELGGTASAYADGSMGEGYAWTGTAHASTSTRVYGHTVIPLLTVLDSVSTQQVYVGQHIIAGGLAPTVAAGAGAGTSPTVTVTGTDTAGTLSVTTGTSPSAALLATVTFSGAYAAAPRISLQPTNSAAAGLNHYAGSTTSTFTVSSQNAPAASTAYTWHYQVIG